MSDQKSTIRKYIVTLWKIIQFVRTMMWYSIRYVLFTDTNNKIIVKTYLLRLIGGVDDTKCGKYKLRPLMIHCNA